MAMKKNIIRGEEVLGAVTIEERRREADFKSRLKKFFPNITQINFVYTEINVKGKTTDKLREEGCFGYHMRESILVNGKPIKIAWLPHIKDMPPTYIEMIVDRVVEEVAEVVNGNGDSDSLGADCRQPVGVDSTQPPAPQARKKQG